jgi:hypothetical protein
MMPDELWNETARAQLDRIARTVALLAIERINEAIREAEQTLAQEGAAYTVADVFKRAAVAARDRADGKIFAGPP